MEPLPDFWGRLHARPSKIGVEFVPYTIFLTNVKYFDKIVFDPVEGSFRRGIPDNWPKRDRNELRSVQHLVPRRGSLSLTDGLWVSRAHIHPLTREGKGKRKERV